MAHFNLDDYTTVADRIKKFWSEHPEGRIATRLEANTPDLKAFVVFAEVFKDCKDEKPWATGLAEEHFLNTGPNQTSPIENCETSAIGRALANAGYATSSADRPSREEMEKVNRGASQAPQTPPEGPTAYAGARQTQSAPTGDKRRVTSGELAYYQFAEELNLKSAEPNSFMTDVVGKMAKWEVSPKQISAVEKTAFKILSEAGFDPKGEKERLSTAVASVAEAFAPTEAPSFDDEPF